MSRKGVLAGFALGAVTVLGVEAATGVFTPAPATVVAGTALAVPAPAPAPAKPSPPPPSSTAPAAAVAQAPASTSPRAPAPQARGTVRLPGGGTATLVRKELGPNGELPIPTDLGQATWWGAELGAPGGATVFAGHVNWHGATGPFAELWTERIGGVVTVVDAAGKPWHFQVSQLVTVHKNDLAARADDLFGPSGAHRLVLVTCGGRWVGGADGYEENRVVIADPS